MATRTILHSKLIVNSALLIGGLGLYMNRNTIKASPTFEGVPVSATLLIHQASPLFYQEFPGLTLAPSFAPKKQLNHTYEETGGILGIYPTGCELGIPVYEKLTEIEETRLGKALLAKPSVAHLVIKGSCKVGCATAFLTEMKLFKVDSEKGILYESPVWNWSLPKSP